MYRVLSTMFQRNSEIRNPTFLCLAFGFLNSSFYIHHSLTIPSLFAIENLSPTFVVAECLYE
jgi:hypothetical protein